MEQQHTEAMHSKNVHRVIVYITSHYFHLPHLASSPWTLPPRDLSNFLFSKMDVMYWRHTPLTKLTERNHWLFLFYTFLLLLRRFRVQFQTHSSPRMIVHPQAEHKGRCATFTFISLIYIPPRILCQDLVPQLSVEKISYLKWYLIWSLGPNNYYHLKAYF